jgi:hypothetical protein
MLKTLFVNLQIYKKSPRSKLRGLNVSVRQGTPKRTNAEETISNNGVECGTPNSATVAVRSPDGQTARSTLSRPRNTWPGTPLDTWPGNTWPGTPLGTWPDTPPELSDPGRLHLLPVIRTPSTQKLQWPKRTPIQNAS